MASTILMSLDLGTTSTRVVLYDRDAKQVAVAQREHTQYFPHPGWVEHDANELWQNTRELMALALARGGYSANDVLSIGMTNQRETVVAWDRNTGKPVYRAIVWQDTRTDDQIQHLQDTLSDQDKEELQKTTGLPLSSYFSVSKIAWLFDNVPEVSRLAADNQLMIGTIDTWILWNLTGGTNGGVHATEVTNASRTGLMNLQSCQWDFQLCGMYGLDPDLLVGALPEIRPSVDRFGEVAEGLPVAGVPIFGILGDQQSAAFGQAIFDAGQAKNTYGTGCFLLHNTGTEPVFSANGLITTIAYQLPDEDPVYALEGSVAQAGSVVQWLRDQLGIISTSAEVETLAETVEDSGGVYFVPAFSGLFAPYWRPDARGMIIGLTSYATKAHIAKAALDAIAYQTYDVVQAIIEDTGAVPEFLRVDGGMSVNHALMQFQADVLDIPLMRPEDVETTARGAVFAAGLGAGVWESTRELTELWHAQVSWEPDMAAQTRQNRLDGWSQAIDHAVGWDFDTAH